MTTLSSRNIPVTIVVPVKNEEYHLPNCLASVERFTEVVVIDSSSTDRTREIVERSAATYVNFEWSGQYPKKRNWYLLNHPVQNDWVLFLDADENVSDIFCEALLREINGTKHSGYWLNYTNYFMGRPLKYGVKQKKLSLFKKSSGLYEKIDEDNWSVLDMEVHEHPIIDGTVGEIDQVIEHNDYQGIGKFIDRHRNYAIWEARRLKDLEKTKALNDLKLTTRQRIKYRWFSKWWYPWTYFSYAYIVKLGFLDGKAGFAYAFYKCWYFYTITILISENRKT